jgi:hypothetical protein
MIMATQEVVNWINNKIHSSRIKEDFEQMESFCLLWNIFEKKVDNTSTTPLGLSRIEKFIKGNSQNVNINNSVIDSVFSYFQNRYITTGRINSKFEKLFRPQDSNWKARLISILTDNQMSSTTKEKIFGILIIAYRIRNNSFHGTKELPEIVDQKETFEHLNNFLMNFLDKL